MLTLGLVLLCLSIVLFFLSFSPALKDERPTLKFKDLALLSPDAKAKLDKKTFDPLFFLKGVAVVLKPIIGPEMRRRLVRDLGVGQSNMTPEEFVLFKVITVGLLLLVLPGFFGSEALIFAVLISIVVGYMLPEVWIKSKIKNVKSEIIKQLPDTVDLLGLCVNAGLDFMMALKWVVEKSSPNIVVREMGILLQEISVGKPRRDALRDLARKYELPDLSTFARTLIQADKMGTSVSEALNILSEDMRLARFRRGEAMALKAPLKLLAPLLFCIFPVVGILVGGPIFLDFMMNNPIKGLTSN